jgi:hypothetical protein
MKFVGLLWDSFPRPALAAARDGCRAGEPGPKSAGRRRHRASTRIQPWEPHAASASGKSVMNAPSANAIRSIPSNLDYPWLFVSQRRARWVVKFGRCVNHARDSLATARPNARLLMTQRVCHPGVPARTRGNNSLTNIVAQSGFPESNEIRFRNIVGGARNRGSDLRLCRDGGGPGNLR